MKGDEGGVEGPVPIEDASSEDHGPVPRRPDIDVGHFVVVVGGGEGEYGLPCWHTVATPAAAGSSCSKTSMQVWAEVAVEELGYVAHAARSPDVGGHLGDCEVGYLDPFSVNPAVAECLDQEARRGSGFHCAHGCGGGRRSRSPSSRPAPPSRLSPGDREPADHPYRPSAGLRRRKRRGRCTGRNGTLSPRRGLKARAPGRPPQVGLHRGGHSRPRGIRIHSGRAGGVAHESAAGPILSARTSAFRRYPAGSLELR